MPRFYARAYYKRRLCCFFGTLNLEFFNNSDTVLVAFPVYPPASITGLPATHPKMMTSDL
jgi:hypothetical protein